MPYRICIQFSKTILNAGVINVAKTGPYPTGRVVYVNDHPARLPSVFFMRQNGHRSAYQPVQFTVR
jgi:hypothetical protein